MNILNALRTMHTKRLQKADRSVDKLQTRFLQRRGTPTQAPTGGRGRRHRMRKRKDRASSGERRRCHTSPAWKPTGTKRKVIGTNNRV